MNRPVIAALFIVGAMMGGCTQPEPPGPTSDPYADEPTPYRPEAVVVPTPEAGGEQTSRPGRWYVETVDWPRWLPSQDAVLTVNISVEGYWADEPDYPFEGDDWRFRLHVDNGTVEPPDDADWYRSYTLHGTANATTKHVASFRLGDLIEGDAFLGSGHPYYDGNPIVLRLAFHKVHDSGFREAWKTTAWYWPSAGGYELDTGSPATYFVCSSSGDSGTCP